MGDAPGVISFAASKARKHRRIARWKPLGQINRLRPLIQFDAGSPRVGDECNPDANVVHAVGPVSVELDAGRFHLGDECLTDTKGRWAVYVPLRKDGEIVVSEPTAH